jgi:hypothetical protein
VEECKAERILRRVAAQFQLFLVRKTMNYRLVLAGISVFTLDELLVAGVLVNPPGMLVAGMLELVD